jgi:hypothetical protein
MEEEIVPSQYVLKTNYELEDDLNRSKHVVLYNRKILVVFGQIRI